MNDTIRQTRREDYVAKLRDPRWQRKRLEIMQRDEFMCQSCFDAATTLNVHHNYYVSGREPWEYKPEALVTLCEPCHEAETETRRGEEQALLDVLRRIGMKASHLNGLMSALYQAFGDSPQFPDHWDFYLSRYIINFHSVAGDVEKQIAAMIKARQAEKQEAQRVLRSHQ